MTTRVDREPGDRTSAGRGAEHGGARQHAHEHGSGAWSRLAHAFTPHSHDATDSIDSALESSLRGIRAVKISLVVLGITALLQLAMVSFSGSVALLADTVHNFSDALTAVPPWIAFVLGRRAATKRYTYGFGRAEDLAGLFVIAMIALSAVLAGWQAIDRLLNPAPIDNVGWVALAGFVGFIGNEAVALFRIREGRAIGSAALVADGYHARTAGFTSLAVLLGAGGVAVGWDWADPAIGLVITAVIVMVMRTAARDVFRRLMDGVEPGLVEQTEATLAEVPGVSEVRAVRMRWIGHEIHAEADLEVHADSRLQEVHAIVDRAEARLMQAIPRLAAARVRAHPSHVDATQP